MSSHRTSLGFTLIELLVAMVIFALLAVTSWQVFQSVIQARDIANREAQRLAELQYAYLLIQQDFIQTLSYPRVTTTGYQPTLMLGGKSLQFISRRQPDPRYVSRGGVTAIEYAQADSIDSQGQVLVRRLRQPLAVEEAAPTQTILLTNINNLTMTALTPEASAIWPDIESIAQANTELSNNAQTNEQKDKNGASINADLLKPYKKLPLGIQISFDYDKIPITWRFALPKTSQIAAKTVDNDKGNNESLDDNENPQNQGEEDSDSDANGDSRKDNTTATTTLKDIIT